MAVLTHPHSWPIGSELLRQPVLSLLQLAGLDWDMNEVLWSVSCCHLESGSQAAGLGAPVPAGHGVRVRGVTTNSCAQSMRDSRGS